MTAQLSRERLEEIASWEIKITDAGTRHAPFAHIRVYSYEIVEMARMLLAGMDSEPVAKVETVGVCWYADNGVPRKPAVGAALYAAPPAPVAVPDDAALRIPFEKWFAADCAFDESPSATEEDNLAWKEGYWHVWKACRAAMLKDGPVTAATVPDGLASSVKCWCHTCRPVTITDMRFVVCPDCGNKRCPRANDHRNACSGSNELGQVGSAAPAAPEQEV